MTKPKKVSKTVWHRLTRFDGAAIKEALETFSDDRPLIISYSNCSAEFDDEIWEFEELEKFLTYYNRNELISASLRIHVARKDRIDAFIEVFFQNGNSKIRIQSDSDGEVLRAEEIFKKHKKRCQISIDYAQKTIKKNLVIFIGHGRSKSWRDLKDHLCDFHNFKVEAYEIGSRAGMSIANVLQSMKEKSSFALIVMTAENQDSQGRLHARENVIHEAGLFQGHLGFQRAIILLEDGCETFSNIDGIQYIKFSKNNIKEIFGDVIAVINREFFSRDDLD